MRVDLARPPHRRCELLDEQLARVRGAATAPARHVRVNRESAARRMRVVVERLREDRFTPAPSTANETRRSRGSRTARLAPASFASSISPLHAADFAGHDDLLRGVVVRRNDDVRRFGVACSQSDSIDVVELAENRRHRTGPR